MGDLRSLRSVISAVRFVLAETTVQRPRRFQSRRVSKPLARLIWLSPRLPIATSRQVLSITKLGPGEVPLRPRSVSHTTDDDTHLVYLQHGYKHLDAQERCFAAEDQPRTSWQ